MTLEELYLLLAALHRKEHRANKFNAAMNGVNLDEGKDDEDFEAIKMRAAAALAGKSEEDFVFNMIGIEVDSD